MFRLGSGPMLGLILGFDRLTRLTWLTQFRFDINVRIWKMNYFSMVRSGPRKNRDIE